MDFIERKLTGMEGKSYHGNMTENGDKLPDKTPSGKERIDKVTKPQIFESKASGQAKDRQEETGEQKSKISAEQEAASRNKAEAGERARREEQARRERADMIKRIMLKHEGSEEEKGILELLLDILISALTGTGEKIDEEELGKKMEKSEAMQAVRAYMRIRPQNLWKGEDYARMVFMLKPDKSVEAGAIRDRFEKEVEEKKMEKAYYKKRAEIETNWLEQSEGRSSGNTDKEIAEEIAGRKTQAYVDLRGEMKASGEMAAGGISGGSGRKEKESKGDKGDRESNEEKKFQEGLKKAREEFKIFSTENQEKIRAAIDSADPYYFRQLFDFFEEHKGDPEIIKRAAENFLSAYKFNKEHGLKISGNVEQVADLMRQALSDLGFDESSIDSEGGESKSREKVRGIMDRESKQDNIGDQGENAERNEAKGGGGVDSSAEVKKEDVKKNGKKPEGLKKTDEEILKEVKEINKHSSNLPKILETTQEMLAQLKLLREDLKKFGDDFMRTVIDDPEEFRRNPEKYKEKQAHYIVQRTREIAMETQLEQMIRGEKKILGGERDQDLYLGNINEVLEARMKRIEFFHEMGKKERGEDFKSSIIDPDYKGKDLNLKDVVITPENLLLDPNEKGISDDEEERRRSIREKNFRIQTKKAYKEFKEKGTLAKNEELYFKELQRWAGTILKNTDIGYTDKDGKKYSGGLKILSEVYEKLRKVRAIEDKDLNYGNLDELEKKLLGQVKELRDLNFLDYFKNHSYLNFEGKGMNPLTNEVTGSMGYPHSLEGTMMLIAYNKGKEWQTGGDHELVDAEGKFQLKNFLLWMRKEINVLIDWDPIAPINAQQGITFKAGFSQLTLFDILYLPQYTQHQEFEMKGDVSSWYVKGKNGNFENGWGLPQEHPDMPYDVRVNGANGIGLLLEAWENDHEHKDYAALNNPAVWSNSAEWVKARGEISAFNNYVRAALGFKRYMEGSHKGNEIEDYYKNGKQGSLGKAIAAGHLFFRYFSDFTESYAKKGWDDEKNRETVIEVDRDNMAYQALGHNGASYFLQSLAESAFDQVDDTARGKIKGAYRDFIVKRAEEMRDDDVVYKKLVGEEKKNMEFLVENFVNDLKGEELDKIKISLDSFDKLTKLKLDIESKVLGKRIVDQEEQKKYKYGSDKVVVREDVEEEISVGMRKNIGEFFEVVLKQQIPDVPELGDGLKGNIKIDPITGKQKFVTIGDINVYTDAEGDKGRMVTKDEWDKIDAAKRGTTTVGKIVEDFAKKFTKDGEETSNFAEDAKMLENYEKNFGPIYKKYERAKEEYDLAVASGSPDIAIKKKAMDDERINFKPYDDILGRNESLGMALLTKVANVSRDELNMFKRSRTLGNASTADVLIKEALTKSLAKVYGLDEKIEGVYAFSRIWYPLFYMGIAGFNNTSGNSAAIQPEGELSRLMKRRISKMEMGEMGGSKATLAELKALIPPTFFEWTRVKRPGEGKPEHMLIEILQNGKGRDMKPYFMRDLEDNPAKKYDIPTKSESAFHEDGLKKADAVRTLVIEDAEHQFENVVHMDQWGVERVNHEAAIKIFGKWWDNTRLLFNAHGIDFESKIAVDGREVKMIDHLFGGDTKETLRIMKKYYEEHAVELEGRGKKEEAEAYKKWAEELKNKPALAVFLNTVTAAIHEHRDMRGTYEQWSMHTIAQIWMVMDEYLRGKSGLEYKVNDPKIKERPSVIPYKLFNRLLGVHDDDSMEKFQCWDFFYAFVAGFLEGVTGTWVEFKDELALIQKTPPLSA